MPNQRARFAAIISSSLFLSGGLAADAEAAALTPEAVDSASLEAIPAEYRPVDPDAHAAMREGWAGEAIPAEPRPDAAVTRLQVLLDRAGISPGVIDGFDGANMRKAVQAFEFQQGLPPDGILDAELVARLPVGPVMRSYTITAEDEAAIVTPLPEDYAELAERDYLGFESVGELIAERFHMDEDLLAALNPGATFTAGETIHVVDPGPDAKGEVAFIEADKRLRQLRAYAEDGRLLVAYPATIGSRDNPSPSGTHRVAAVAPEPTYTYNPEINFQQGDNTEILTLPPGPNGPVGTTWIDLSEPTYGIHGTPEPTLIDKVGSHGCVRLTNWDAHELAGMVSPGVAVAFVS